MDSQKQAFFQRLGDLLEEFNATVYVGDDGQIMVCFEEDEDLPLDRSLMDVFAR